MKVFFFSKRTLFMLALLLGLAVLGVMVADMMRPALETTAEAGAPYYQGNSGDKAVALTVNVDWGEECIPEMLDIFAEQKVKVSFFPTGQWAEKNPELLKEMNTAGHSIQNHGYKHVHCDQLSCAQVKEQILKGQEIIADITGETPKYFASPYGEHADQVVQAAEELDYCFIMWSLDTIDWQRPSPATINQRILSRAHNDAIILMHPVKETVQALPDMIKGLKEQGYDFYTIDRLLVTDAAQLEGGGLPSS
ncbi:MAG: polysaccharide deacetylase family protein [Syntrophomonadaceae bacterium]|nr:polysaccharide deacetylase family protein [Syntrophomonadaceae bacterium]